MRSILVVNLNYSQLFIFKNLFLVYSIFSLKNKIFFLYLVVLKLLREMYKKLLQYSVKNVLNIFKENYDIRLKVFGFFKRTIKFGNIQLRFY